MKLAEAIMSGKKFTRARYAPGWFSVFSKEDREAEDWVTIDEDVGEVKKELTWTEIAHAFGGSPSMHQIAKEKLGFKE